MNRQGSVSPYRQNHQAQLSHRRRQLPPLQNIIKTEIEAANDRKPKSEEDWEYPSTFVSCESASTTPIATSPAQTYGSSMPALNHSFDELNFCASNDTMLSASNGWGSTSQYSHGTGSPYASSTSSSQSYYNRPTVVTGRNQQNLPSLTEMNLANSTPAYAPRASQLGRQHTSSPYYGTTPTDPLDIAYGKNMQSGFSPGFGLGSTQRAAYAVQSYDWSPVSDPYCYPNGHSWPPSMQCTSNGYVGSDSVSVGSAGRRRRGNLPKHVTDILRQWFHEHLDHPYPSDEDKQMLIMKTHLTISQISNWFINARRRHWPTLKQQRDQIHKAPARLPSTSGPHC